MWFICRILLLSTQTMPRSNFWMPSMCLSMSTSLRSLARRRGTTFWRFRSTTPISPKNGTTEITRLQGTPVTWARVKDDPFGGRTIHKGPAQERLLRRAAFYWEQISFIPASQDSRWRVSAAPAYRSAKLRVPLFAWMWQRYEIK